MKVAHVNQDRGIAPSRKKGAAVHLEVMRRAFRQCGAEVVALDVHERERLSSALSGEHASGAFDLVYERYSRGATTGFEFAHDRRLPFVLEVNAPLALEDELYRAATDGVPAGCERAVFSGAARVLAVSPEVAQYAIDQGADPSRVIVCPNAVDTDVFLPREAGDRLRAELVPEGRFALGFHGRLRPWHNFGLLVDAFEILLRQRESVHLVLLGEGQFEELLKDRVPLDRVTFVGWQPHEQAARVVSCFDALPLSYAADRPFYFSPLKLLEGMAVKAVPIVPRISTLPDVVAHRERGLVYVPGDAEGLAESVCTLIHDPALRRRLGEEARAYAERHSWRDVAQAILDFAQATRP